MLPPPAFSSKGNVPGSAVLWPEINTSRLGVGTVTPSSFPVNSVVHGVSEGSGEVMDGEVMEGGTEGGEELELVLGLAQNKLHHWACTGEERRKRRARERRRAPILFLCLTVVSQHTLMHAYPVHCGHYTCANRHITKTSAAFPAMRGTQHYLHSRILQGVQVNLKKIFKGRLFSLLLFSLLFLFSSSPLSLCPCFLDPSLSLALSLTA